MLFAFARKAWCIFIVLLALRLILLYNYLDLLHATRRCGHRDLPYSKAVSLLTKPSVQRMSIRAGQSPALVEKQQAVQVPRVIKQ